MRRVRFWRSRADARRKEKQAPAGEEVLFRRDTDPTLPCENEAEARQTEETTATKAGSGFEALENSSPRANDRLMSPNKGDNDPEHSAGMSLVGPSAKVKPHLYSSARTDKHGLDTKDKGLSSANSPSREALPTYEMPKWPLYTYQPLIGKRFRIFALEPSLNSSTPIKGRLIESEHDSSIKYEGVSWVWGDLTDTALIIIDGYYHHVRKNLYDALVCLRYADHERFLWADAICINMHDFDERRRQILIVPSIYQRAENVCIWLGGDTADSRRGMAFIREIDRLSDDLDDVIRGLHSLDDWKALVSLMWRPLFSRLWVVQEVGLAQKATVHTGLSWVGWNQFVNAVTAFEDWWSRINPSGLSNLGEPKAWPASRFIQTVGKVFRRDGLGYVKEPLYTLETLVTLLSTLGVTDPRDIVFALIGIAHDVSSKQNHSDANAFSTSFPDYSVSVVEVYEAFVNFCVFRSGSLDILLRPWAPRKLALELPSWMANVEDNAFQTTVTDSGTRIIRCNADPLVGSAEQKPFYRTADGSRAVFLWKSNLRPGVRSLVRVRGFILDSISEITPPSLFGNIPRAWIDLGRSSTVDPESFCRTLLGDRLANGRRVPRHQVEILEGILNENSNIEGLHVDRLLLDGTSSIVKSILRRIQSVVWGRTLVKTAKSNFLGIAPRIARPGDKICILFGCSVPVILRTTSVTETEDSFASFQFIGAAYIHGVMDGQAFRVQQLMSHSMSSKITSFTPKHSRFLEIVPDRDPLPGTRLPSAASALMKTRRGSKEIDKRPISLESLSSSPSFEPVARANESTIPFHASCPKCHHFFNQVPLSIPTRPVDKVDVICPVCHHLVCRLGRNYSQESLFSQETALEPDGNDWEDIKSPVDDASSERFTVSPLNKGVLKESPNISSRRASVSIQETFQGASPDLMRKRSPTDLNKSEAQWEVPRRPITSSTPFSDNVLNSNQDPVPDVALKSFRLNWTCTCGHKGFDDYVQYRPDAVFALQNRLRQDGIKTSFESKSISDPVSEAVNFVWLNLRNLVSNYMTRFVGDGPQASSGRGMGTSTAQSSASSQTSAAQQAPSSATQAAKLSATGESSRSGMVQIAATSNSERTLGTVLNDFMLLCINDERWLTTREDLNVTEPPILSDEQLFQEIRKRYFARFSYLRLKLSLKSVQRITFVKFALRESHEVDSLEPDQIPPTTERHYDFHLRQPHVIPPIGNNFLMHRFSEPSRCGRSTFCLKQIPKRIEQRPEYGVAPDLYTAWGVHFQEGLDLFRMCIWSFVGFASSLAFAVTWAVVRKSLADAFAVGAYFLAFEAVAVASVQTAITQGYL